MGNGDRLQEAVEVHTIDFMEAACNLAESLGYQVRREWLGGATGGRCEFAGRKWIFVDMSLSKLEQLDQIKVALQESPELQQAELEPTMQWFLGGDRERRAA